ncbi:unnamed protein product [Brachionus calyciflorus]|uniref:Uncharacterized protein n=1 Tax=Brachionus calyciflorus TaxID=104777 RepID=A0A813MJD0_9BILA|nr:unnamed protein product [Brachionus calyciflorus]
MIALIDAIYSLNITKNSNFLYKHSLNKHVVVQTNQLNSFNNHSINKSGNRPIFTSKVYNSKQGIPVATTPVVKPRLKVYRLDNAFVKNLKVNKTLEPKENLKISLKNSNFLNRHSKNGLVRKMEWSAQEPSFIKTREKPFQIVKKGDTIQYNKNNQTINFLSNVNFYLTKLQKEAEYLESNFKGYGKKFFYLLKFKLKNAYEELRLNLCNNVLDTDDEFDDDYADLERETYKYVNSNNIIEKMKRNERKRTIRAKNEKRLIRKICN